MELLGDKNFDGMIGLKQCNKIMRAYRRLDGKLVGMTFCPKEIFGELEHIPGVNMPTAYYCPTHYFQLLPQYLELRERNMLH